MGSYLPIGPDPSEPEWALYRRSSNMLAGTYCTRRAAECRAEELGPGYVVVHLRRAKTTDAGALPPAVADADDGAGLSLPG